MQLRFAEDRFTVPLFCAASKRHCIWKRQGKNNSCTPKSLSLSRFSIPLATARVVGALVSSFSGVRCKGTGEFISVQLRCRQLFVHSFNFNVLALHMEKRLWNDSCTPKSWSRFYFSIPVVVCCCRVGALVGSFQV